MSNGASNTVYSTGICFWDQIETKKSNAHFVTILKYWLKLIFMQLFTRMIHISSTCHFTNGSQHFKQLTCFLKKQLEALMTKMLTQQLQPRFKGSYSYSHWSDFFKIHNINTKMKLLSFFGMHRKNTIKICKECLK